MNSEANAAKFFDGFAGTFDTLYDEKRNFFMQWVDRHFRSDMFIRFALSFQVMGNLSEKTVLDIGCGSGPYVLEALNRGAKHVTAVDPAPNMLALTQHRLEHAGWAEKCKLVEAAFPGVDLEQHDHIIVMGVMDYVADAGSFLSELKPLAKLSAVVSFPSVHWFRTPARKLRYYVRNCPVHFYTQTEIIELCRRAGFETIDIKKIAGAGMDYHVCLKP